MFRILSLALSLTLLFPHITNTCDQIPQWINVKTTIILGNQQFEEIHTISVNTESTFHDVANDLSKKLQAPVLLIFAGHNVTDDESLLTQPKGLAGCVDLNQPKGKADLNAIVRLKNIHKKVTDRQIGIKHK